MSLFIITLSLGLGEDSTRNMQKNDALLENEEWFRKNPEHWKNLSPEEREKIKNIMREKRQQEGKAFGGEKNEEWFRKNPEHWKNLSPEEREKIKNTMREKRQQQEGNALGGEKNEERFHKNQEHWKNLSEEEREKMRNKAQEMHGEIQQQLGEALTRSGLQLEEKEKKEFMRAYMQGRKAIEMELREKMQGERKIREAQLLEQLTQQFSKK